MSFACHIWEYPAPRHGAEVDPILKALHDVPAPQNPRFIELAKRLTARYPCITTTEDEAQYAWSDGPLNGVCDEAVYGVGILTRRLEEVFPFVVETANDLGLNVHDTVGGETYRPDGTVVEFEQSPPERLSSTGVDLEKIQALVTARFQDVAVANGFRKLGDNYVRGMDDGWQSFGARVAEVQGAVLVDVVVDIYSYPVMRLCHSLDPERHAGDAQGRTFSLSVYEFFDNPRSRLILREPGDVQSIVNSVRPFVTEKLMALADSARTLEGLDRVMNTGRTRIRHYPLNHLIVSRLLCNPAYDALYDKLREDGHIGDRAQPFLSVMRQTLAMRIRCGNERVLVSSFGPAGAKVGWMGGGEKPG